MDRQTCAGWTKTCLVKRLADLLLLIADTGFWWPNANHMQAFVNFVGTALNLCQIYWFSSILRQYADRRKTAFSGMLVLSKKIHVRI